MENVDKNIVLAAVERIESMTDEEIRQVIATIPDEILKKDDKTRIENGLIQRRGTIRKFMQDKGWLQ